MAGPLLVFGFMVLPPLAARTLARGMGSFLSLSSLDWASSSRFSGFYLSVRLDLPLGPTDVAFGCVLIFVVYAVQLILRQESRVHWSFSGACVCSVSAAARKNSRHSTCRR